MKLSWRKERLEMRERGVRDWKKEKKKTAGPREEKIFIDDLPSAGV